MAELNRSTTERGFTVYDEFTDTYGSKVRVQESSFATEPCCWIFAGAASMAVSTHQPHLNVEQARRVRDALDTFIGEHEEARDGQPGQVPPGHPDAGKPVGWGEHPRDCDCGECP